MSAVRSGAHALLDALRARGVRHVFANAGTDFAPLIEALAETATRGAPVPLFHAVPHENLAMAMALGYARVSGEPVAVMVHVTVGTANALCGLMNAARDGIPLLLLAGRTPHTESGHTGSRNVGIHWGQDSFDQGGMLREYVKWDYELRAGQAPDAVVARALDIAMSEPRGPVYLTLPRELLAAPAPAARIEQRTAGAVPAVPAAQAIEELARAILAADFPLLLSAASGRDPANVARLATLAQDFAIGVASPGEPGARDLNIPTAHPLYLGSNPLEALGRADLVIALDCEVPWWPHQGGPRPGARLVQIGADPLYARMAWRGFEAQPAIAGSSSAALQMLQDALGRLAAGNDARLAARRQRIASLAAARRAHDQARIQRAATLASITPEWIACCVNRLKGAEAIVVNELGVGMDLLDLAAPRTYIGSSPAGGLGSGLGAALGAKLAAPGRRVILLVGDGSYLFGEPVSAHMLARAEQLPVLTIVLNNGCWNAVRRSTLALYPDGHAAAAAQMPLVALPPAADYERIAEACGGFGERVLHPAALLPALERALSAIDNGRHALLNVITSPVSHFHAEEALHHETPES